MNKHLTRDDLKAIERAPQTGGMDPIAGFIETYLQKHPTPGPAQQIAQKEGMSEYQHTKERALERYDVDLSEELYAWIVLQISMHRQERFYHVNESRHSVAILVDTEVSNRQSIYDVPLDNAPTLRCVWSWDRRCITTVLPPA